MTILGNGKIVNIQWKVYSSLIKKIMIEDGVTSIGASAFKDCSNLTNITIPDSVTSIGDLTFSGCTSLTSITIPDSIISIGWSAFKDCSKLTDIDVGEENKYFSSVDGNLYNKSKTKIIQYTAGKKQNSFSIPNSVTSIENSAFSGCSNLTSITIPNSVTSIGNHAFYNCSRLTDVYYDGNRSQFYKIKIGSDNDSLTKAKLHCSITTDSGTTGDCQWTFDESTGTLTISGNGKIANVPWKIYNFLIKNIVIEDGVTSICDYAFNECKNLTSITIPNSVTSIGKSAFEGSSNLTSIKISDSVTSIGDDAFNGCSSLTSITIPNSVTSIGGYAFYGTGYYNDKNNWDNDLLYINNYLIRAKTNIEKCSIKKDTKLIANSAFSGCSNLKDVYYDGTATQWHSMNVYDDNKKLLEVNIHFLQKGPTTTKPTVKKVVKVSLSKKSVVLVKGRSTTVKATVTPTNATNKKLKWTTSNSKVAVVNSQGKITAKGRGNATIKVMTLDGSNKYATVKVTVKQPVTLVKLNRKSANLKVKGKAKQKTVTLKATAYPKNANNKAVSWKSSNTKIATVNSKGKVIAKKKGTCYITATAKDGSKKSAKCKIVVK